MKFRSLPYFAGLLAVAVVLAGLSLLDRSTQVRFQEENRTSVLRELSTTRARLEGALNSRLFLTQGLVAHASIQPDITVREFQELARALAVQKTGIRSIQLAKDTVVSHVYPIQGNEKAIGLKILEHPKQRQAAQRAVDTKKTVVAGPVDLVQGGVAFISRTPIFLTPDGQAPGSGPYWGLATIIIMKEALFEEAGLFDTSAKLQYALRGKDGLGASGSAFFGDEAIFQSNPVVLDVSLPNGSWQLAGIPVGGWLSIAPGSWGLRIGGGVFAIVAGILVAILARYPARLREAVERATTALRESEERLRQSHKMEAVGRLAGGVAHDFNNLLTVITGRTQLLLARLRPGDPLLRDIDLIQETADRAAALIRQLLAFSRKQVLQPKVLDLCVIVADMETMLRRLIGEDIDLVVRRRSNLEKVKADPGQIEQVIMNLAVNARDAMPQGGKLTIEIANIELDAAFARQNPGARPGPHVLLAVSDTGFGMDAETQARIFEPFFTTKEPGKGTGLGLATVYGIVTQSGGYIGVDSMPGHGTVFKIYLPRIEEAVEVRELATVLTQPRLGSETIASFLGSEL